MKRRVGLQAWLVAAFVAVGAAASLVVLLVVLPTLESSVRSDQRNRQAREVLHALTTTRLVGLSAQTAANLLSTAVGGEARLTSTEGLIVPPNIPRVHTFLPPGTVTPEAKSALSFSTSQAVLADNLIIATAPVDLRDGHDWAAEAAVPVEHTSSAIAIVRRRLFFGVGAVLVLASLAGLGIAHLIGRRIRRLAKTATTLAGGDLSARAPDSSPRELSTLGDSLNTMAERLDGLVAETLSDRDRARALVASLAEGVLAVSPDGSVTIANEAAQRYLGLPPGAESLGLEELPAQIGDAVRAVLGAGECSAFRSEAVLPSGAEMELSVACAEKGAAVVVTMRDVTVERRLDRARRDLVANVSHELKTPLTALKGFLELLEDEGLSPARRREFIALMSQESARLERLVEEQLELARLDAGALPLERTRVDLGDIVEEVVASRRLLAERAGVTLTGPAGDEPVVVEADAARIEQILLILLDNALRHTPQGGRVEVLVGREGRSGWLAVRDTGEGIPTEAQPFVFDRFYRADASREGRGAGLGLAIARGLAEAHGGSVDLRSQLGAGSTFTVRLPVASPVPVQTTGAANRV